MFASSKLVQAFTKTINFESYLTFMQSHKKIYNLHSIVSLVLILCCVFCILIRFVPFVHYYPLFSVKLLCNLCIFSVNLVITVVPSL